MNGCEAIRENLCEWLDHELPAELRAGVDAHLRQCEACRAELELLRAASGAVHDLPALKAPASLLPKIREEIKKEAATATASATASADTPTPVIRAGEAFQRKSARPWTRGLVSLAAFLAMGVLVYTAITPHVPSTVTSSDQSSMTEEKKEEKALAANIDAAGKESAQDLAADGKPGSPGPASAGREAHDRLAGTRAVAPAEPADPRSEPDSERAAQQPAAKPAPDQLANEALALDAGRDADKPADGVERANGRRGQEAWKAEQGAAETNRRGRKDGGQEALKKSAAPAKEAQPFASVPKGDDSEWKDRGGAEESRKEKEEAALRMKSEPGTAPAAPPAAEAPRPVAKAEGKAAPNAGWNQPTPAEPMAPAKPTASEPQKDVPDHAGDLQEKMVRKSTRDEGARTGDLAKLQEESGKQLDKSNGNALADEKARESGAQPREVLTIERNDADAEPARLAQQEAAEKKAKDAGPMTRAGDVRGAGGGAGAAESKIAGAQAVVEPARVRVLAGHWDDFTRDLQAKAKSMGGQMQLGASKTGHPAEKNAEAAKAPEQAEAKQEARIERLVVQVPERRKDEFLAALNAMGRRYRMAENEKALAASEQEAQKAATAGALRQEAESKRDIGRDALVTIEILAEIEP